MNKTFKIPKYVNIARRSKGSGNGSNPRFKKSSRFIRRYFKMKITDISPNVYELSKACLEV